MIFTEEVCRGLVDCWTYAMAMLAMASMTRYWSSMMFELELRDRGKGWMDGRMCVCLEN